QKFLANRAIYRSVKVVPILKNIGYTKYSHIRVEGFQNSPRHLCHANTTYLEQFKALPFRTQLRVRIYLDLQSSIRIFIYPFGHVYHPFMHGMSDIQSMSEFYYVDIPCF